MMPTTATSNLALPQPEQLVIASAEPPRQVSRRRFLEILAGAGAGVAAAAAAAGVVPAVRSYFFAPAGGWLKPEIVPAPALPFFEYSIAESKRGVDGLFEIVYFYQFIPTSPGSVFGTARHLKAEFWRGGSLLHTSYTRESSVAEGSL